MDLPKIPTTSESDRLGIDLGSHLLGSAVPEGSGAPIDSYEGTAAANGASILGNVSTTSAQSVAVRLQVPAGRGENFFSAASMQQRLNDALGGRGFPENILTVSQQGDGAIVIQAQSHKPQEATWQSWSRSLTFLRETSREASRAKEQLLQGNEQGFDQIVAAWGARFTDLASLKITIRGLENLDPNKTYLFAPTHMSLTEYGILFMALHGMPIGFMAKDEFRSNPLTFKLFGQAMAGSDRFVFIQREDRNAAKAAAGAATNLLSQEDNPYSLVVYPQGTRGPARTDANGRRMDADLFAKGPLKDGLGFMSLGTLQAGNPVEIVPIVINGLGQVWPKSPIEIAALQGNGGVEIIVGKPLSPSAYHPSNNFSPDSIKGAARAMVAAIESFYRAHYKAPLSTPEEVAARQAKSKKATAKAAQTPVQALEAGAAMVAGQPATVEGGWFSGMFASALEYVDKRFLGEKIRTKVLSQFISGRVYTPAQQYQHAHAYLRQLPGMLAQQVKAAINEKLGRNNVLLQAGAVTARPALPAIDEISPEETIEKLNILSQVSLDKLLAEIDPMIQETYGHDAELLEAARKFARDYYTHVYKTDLPAAVKLMAQSIFPSDQAVREAAQSVIKNFSKMSVGGLVLSELEQGALREFEDARHLTDRPDGVAGNYFDFIVAAEKNLEKIKRDGRLSTESESNYEQRVKQARIAVAVALDKYAEKAGLGAGSNTYRNLDRFILNLEPHVFRYAMRGSNDGVADALLQNLTHLDQLKQEYAKQQDALKLATKKKDEQGIAAAKVQLETTKVRIGNVASEARGRLRNLMDEPEKARTLQRGLIEFHATYDLLVTDRDEAESRQRHAKFYDAVKQAYADQKTPAIIDSYSRLYQAWQSSGSNRTQQLRAEERLNRAEAALLKDEAGLKVLQAMASNISSLPAGVENHDAAMQAHHTYWQQRRAWAGEVRTQNQQVLPLWTKYLGETELAVMDLARREAQLIFEAAGKLMSQVVNPQPDLKKLYDTAVAEYENGSSLFERQINRRQEHWSKLNDTTQHKETEKVAHAIDLNRALESLHAGAGAAYDVAARAAGVSPSGSRRKLHSLTATALHHKLASTDDKLVHQERARNTISSYFGLFTIPKVQGAVWVARQAVPARFIDPLIQTWASDLSTDFHRLSVSDARAPRLPATQWQVDATHNAGWFGDYSAGLATSDGRLVAKPDLIEKMPPPMQQGVDILAYMLPDENNQTWLEAGMISAGLYGYTSPILGYELNGAQSLTLYGAATMGVIGQPDAVNMLSADLVFGSDNQTGYEMPGFGRGPIVAEGRRTLQGTVGRTVEIVTTTVGGHGAGPKPDKPYMISPQEVEMRVDQVDSLALPEGLPETYAYRYTPQTHTAMLQRIAFLNSMARRVDLRELASSTPDGASTEVSYKGKTYQAVGIPIRARSTQTTQRAASPVGRR